MDDEGVGSGLNIAVEEPMPTARVKEGGDEGEAAGFGELAEGKAQVGEHRWVWASSIDPRPGAGVTRKNPRRPDAGWSGSTRRFKRADLSALHLDLAGLAFQISSKPGEPLAARTPLSLRISSVAATISLRTKTKDSVPPAGELDCEEFVLRVAQHKATKWGRFLMATPLTVWTTREIGLS